MQCKQAAFVMHAAACLKPQIGTEMDLCCICSKVGFEPRLTTLYLMTSSVIKTIKYICIAQSVT